jgi:L-iditol 2-dehydrogenase
VIIDMLESRLEFAENFGASQTYKMQSDSPQHNAEALLAQARLEDGADIVIDATGAEPCIECGVSALKRGGTFVQAGLGSTRSLFPIGQICGKEATLKGGFRYGPLDYKLAIELLNSKRINVRDLITHEFHFSDAEQAYKNVAGRVGIKTIIYGPGVDKGMACRTFDDPLT